MIRLLHEKEDGSFGFVKCDDGSVPPYAIFSHTWSLRQEQDEVTYDDVCNGVGRRKKGYRKLELCARWAARDDLRFFWVDTCCINKGDLAELQEALTSMFRWFGEAAKCFVYIEDVVKLSSRDEVAGSKRKGTKVHGSNGAKIENERPRDESSGLVEVKSEDEHRSNGAKVENERPRDESSGLVEVKEEDMDVQHEFVHQGIARTGSWTENILGFPLIDGSATAASGAQWPSTEDVNPTEDTELEDTTFEGDGFQYNGPVPSEPYDMLVESLTWRLEFRDCKWFTRGWTLQELLAPPAVEFFSADEQRLGDRQSLCEEISETTNIPEEVLTGDMKPSHFSIEQLKSWAQKRRTRRPEDTAYCLMGIFDVSICVSYGEGKERAHARLDEAIGKAWEGRKSLEPRPRFRWTFVSLAAILSICLGLLFMVSGTSPSPSYPEIDASLPVFAILGKTGVGKSTFIETLGGRNVKTREGPTVCHDLESCTNEISFFRAELPFGHAYLVDTPGFDDSKGRDDNMILSMVFEELRRLYDGDKLLKGVIYLYDISAPRIGGMNANILLKIMQLCGLNGLRNLVLVTTRWANPLDHTELAKQLVREQNLTDRYWKYAQKHGSRMERFKGTKDSASAILGILNHQERNFDPTMPLRELWVDLEQQAIEAEKEIHCPLEDPDTVTFTGSFGRRFPHLVVWKMASAYTVCSAPWWTALAILLQLVLVTVFHLAALLASAFIGDQLLQCLKRAKRTKNTKLDLREEQSSDRPSSTQAFVAVVVLASAAALSAFILGGIQVGKVPDLMGRDCRVCFLTSWSLYKFPAC